MAEEDEEEPSFGKGCRKGGARHFSKPFVDNGLVYSVFVDNKDLLQDLKNYKCTSKNNSPDAKGLVQTLPLWKGLLRLESSGEIHSQPLRTALIKLLSEYPEMNRSAQSGQVWANLRLERITTILYHVRKVGREAGKDGLYACAAKLTRQQYEHLQGGLKLLEGSVAKEKALEKANPPQEEKVLEKAESSHAKLPVKTDSKRKLKQEDSEVSMDNNGFPKMFGSPESTEKAEAMPVAAMAMDRRRPGNKTQPLEKGELHQALGFGTQAQKKKPAAALEKVKKAGALGKAQIKRPAGALEKVQHQRKPWVKIRKTVAKKSNPRAYLTGTTQEGSPLQLIVEVTAKRCPQGYMEVIDQIWTSLEKDGLTKEEAVDLREKLRKQWGC